MDNYVGIGKTAERLGVNRESARRLIRVGRLPGAKVGRRWLVEQQELEKFARSYVGRPGCVSQAPGRGKGCNICGRRPLVWDEGPDRYCRVHEPIPSYSE